jgi:TRAP-type C4-dicarboxylate transport system substrate-binding protein
MDLNKIIFLMMLCVPMFVGAQTLTFTDHEPMGNMRTQVTRQFFRLVEQESKGRIRIDHHWNGELSSSYDAYETVREGTKADMATVVPEYDSQRMPLHQLFKSFLAGPSGEAQVALIRKAYKTIPELTEELHHAGIHPVLVATGYPVGFYSREPMADLNALKEQTWRTASFWHISYLENAGATNKRISWGEQVSDSLRSGAIDGIMVNIDSGWDIGAHRAAPHLLVSQELWLGHIYLVAMNLDRWNALPPKDKRAIERAASKTYKAMGKTMDESYEQMLQQLSNEGCTVRRLTHEEVSDFVTNVRQSEVQERWVKEKESEGTADVRRVFEKLRSLVQHSAKRKQ